MSKIYYICKFISPLKGTIPYNNLTISKQTFLDNLMADLSIKKHFICFYENIFGMYIIILEKNKYLEYGNLSSGVLYILDEFCSNKEDI